MNPFVSLYFVLLSRIVLCRSSHSHESAQEAQSWPSFRGFASFLQLGSDVAGFATLGTAFLPAHMQGLAGPLVTLATAKANAKKGISNVFTAGEDYPWVCTCEPFSSYPRTVNDMKKCPYDIELGCYTPPAR